MLNADKKFLAQKSAPPRDFYSVRKVNTHVHHSACMNQKHLVKSLDLTGYNLNVDLLDVRTDKSTFHRFDEFNLRPLRRVKTQTNTNLVKQPIH
ncbi:hypothetical protein KIW84_064046 [Lathyrus oleraceus]|nr:hypothetical protein KIW84_064046 [Pisum sativum]